VYAGQWDEGSLPRVAAIRLEVAEAQDMAELNQGTATLGI